MKVVDMSVSFNWAFVWPRCKI